MNGVYQIILCIRQSYKCFFIDSKVKAEVCFEILVLGILQDIRFMGQVTKVVFICVFEWKEGF